MDNKKHYLGIKVKYVIRMNTFPSQKIELNFVPCEIGYVFRRNSYLK